MFDHALDAPAANDTDGAVVHRDATLYMQAVDRVSGLRQLHGPVRFLSILRCVLRPRGPLHIQTRALHGQLCVDHEREHRLIFPVDADSRRQVMAEGQLG